MAKYVYPAVLSSEGDGFYVNFPDIESCYTQGEDLADALEMAKDVLALMLCQYEDNKKPIPKATSQEGIALEESQIVTLVSADTTEYRRIWDSRAVKKTLTIPSWLNSLAEREGVNFSQTLQKALKEELQIAE